MSRPRALDLFCGAGGVSVGLERAGFDVTGIDINPQPHHRGGNFIQADVMDVLQEVDWLLGFDFIWASPPCQAFTSLRKCNGPRNYPDLIATTRERLQAWGGVWVIENVPGSPLRYGFTLCGVSFGLKVYRHRLFEPSFAVLAPPCPGHPESMPSAGRGPTPGGYICVAGDGGYSVKVAGPAMGITWMNRKELSQAIPPAYAEWIGREAMKVVRP